MRKVCKQRKEAEKMNRTIEDIGEEEEEEEK